MPQYALNIANLLSPQSAAAPGYGFSARPQPWRSLPHVPSKRETALTSVCVWLSGRTNLVRSGTGAAGFGPAHHACKTVSYRQGQAADGQLPPISRPAPNPLEALAAEHHQAAALMSCRWPCGRCASASRPAQGLLSGSVPLARPAVSQDAGPWAAGTDASLDVPASTSTWTVA